MLFNHSRAFPKAAIPGCNTRTLRSGDPCGRNFERTKSCNLGQVLSSKVGTVLYCSPQAGPRDGKPGLVLLAKSVGDVGMNPVALAPEKKETASWVWFFLGSFFFSFPASFSPRLLDTGFSVQGLCLRFWEVCMTVRRICGAAGSSCMPGPRVVKRPGSHSYAYSFSHWGSMMGSKGSQNLG